MNYHFGDKEQLYIEAVLEAHRCGTEMLPERRPAGEGTPAEQLRRYIHHFLEQRAGDEPREATLAPRA